MGGPGGGPLKTNQKPEATDQRPQGSLEARRQRPEGATGHALRLKARWRIYTYIQDPSSRALVSPASPHGGTIPIGEPRDLLMLP